MAGVCKNYKPEILYCPFCNTKLVYRHSVSNKLIYFTNGRRIRVRNLGYSCPNCKNDKIYFSQTAKKFAFKNYTYSVKTVCMIALLKEQGMGREEICDYFYDKNIEISDRNVDNLYKAYLQAKTIDYKQTIPQAYELMLKEYQMIRLSIDLISIEETRFILVYDFFNGNLLALQSFNTLNDPKLKEFLSSFLNPQLKITLIASIRKDSTFIPLIKSLCPSSTKFITFNKF